MDDRRVEIVLGNGDVEPCSQSKDLATPSQESGIAESVSIADASPFSNNSEAVSTDEEPKLPILKKIGKLSDKIQVLRKEHSALSTEVKEMTSKPFPGSEVLNTLQELSKNHEFLKKRYLEEYGERKRLYNEVIELKGNIRVFCRCRPLNKNEVTNGSTSVVEIPPSQDHELNVACADSSKKQFKFDHVFGPETKQEDVFAETLPIVTSVLDGYNVCIFAYGQTGTGKTFTMEGTPENRGVNYRTLKELFRIADHRSCTMKYELCVSMLEVYNERIRDLLVENTSEPPKKLEIKQSAEGTQEVPGLVEARVYGTEEVWELLKTGSRVRSVGSTNANELSSRSHCLLRVIVKGENLVNGQKTKSNLWLVDLAGSERVGRIEVEGERLKESQFINKSLSALGDVISALASKTSHVPYRNSKLTHMLQSSLGGDCKTLMFVQISPADTDLGETLCSLNFASRVKGIDHGPARKQADVSELLKYKYMAEKLKNDEKETKRLQDNVQSLQLRLATREQICRSLQEKVRELENQLGEERKLRLKQESRSVASGSTRPPKQAQRTTSLAPTKPPLGRPPNTRMPLRRISNFMPPQSSLQPKKALNLPSFHPGSSDGKENNLCPTNTRGALRGPRRVSIAARPSAQMVEPTLQPRRRISIATLRPEPNSHLSTQLNTQSKRESTLPRPSFVSGIGRVRRFSKVFTPMPESRTMASSSVEATPMSSRRFMPSPPSQQVGSWKPKHPTVVALQKKPLVWSPLRLRGLQNSKVFTPMPESRTMASSSVEATPMSSRRFVPSPSSEQVGSWKPKHPTVVALQKKQLVWSPLKLRGLQNFRRSLALP
ncbi:kinesin-like protein KIN-14S [Silene latifolia]|uniref:kinesin-like protein KIN-14S n=1 Tax=Silene latifolia TaxID=37657 RepID=UPI003D773680